MNTAADTLVARFPTAVSQLRGPVYQYLKKYAPFRTEQSLYLAVFYPAARTWPIEKQFSETIRRVNPGINTVGDYVRKCRSAGARVPRPAGEIGRALNEIAGLLGVSVDWLHNMISLESAWKPQARNPFSGARGLIQFMPKTAAGMGFTVGAGISAILLIGVGVWFLLK